MGRGRAKAKQTKVARELKYSTPDTDLTALQRELSGHDGGSSGTPRAVDDSVEDSPSEDPYADYAAKYAADPDDGYGERRASSRR